MTAKPYHTLAGYKNIDSPTLISQSATEKLVPGTQWREHRIITWESTGGKIPQMVRVETTKRELVKNLGGKK
jgi:hypothetical protein